MLYFCVTGEKCIAQNKSKRRGVQHYVSGCPALPYARRHPALPYQNPIFSKIDASGFVELVKRRFGVFFSCNMLLNSILTIFQTFSTFRPKSARSDVKKSIIASSKISDRSPSNFHRLVQLIPQTVSIKDGS